MPATPRRREGGQEQPAGGSSLASVPDVPESRVCCCSCLLAPFQPPRDPSAASHRRAAVGAGVWVGTPPSALTPTREDRACPPGGARGEHHQRCMHVFKGLFYFWKTRKQTFLSDTPQKAKLNPDDRAVLSPGVDGHMGVGADWLRFLSEAGMDCKTRVQVWPSQVGKVILSALGGGGTMPRDFEELGPSVWGKGCKQEACMPRWARRWVCLAPSSVRDI